MLVEIEFQYRLMEVNSHLIQMTANAESIIVTLIVLLASIYLGRRYLHARRAKADSPCGGGTCGCSAPKPKQAARQ